MIVPGLALAQAIGRWGNFFNMEAYGLPITDPAWQFFPAAVLIPEQGGAVWHMATFFYESVWDLLVFITLASIRRKTQKRGDLTLWYMLLYGAGRLVIEGLRTDSLMTTGGSFRISQLLSMLLCLSVALWFGIRLLRHRLNRRVACAGAAAALIACVLAFMLPSPFQLLPGYRWLWAAQLMLLAGLTTAAAMVTRRLPILPLAALCLSLCCGLLPVVGTSAPLTGIVYSAACIACAADLYPRNTDL